MGLFLPKLTHEQDTPAMRQRRFLGYVALTLLIAALIWQGRPAYQALKGMRAHRLGAEALQAMRTQQWEAAFSKAQAAYQLSPADAVTQRIVAQLYTAVGQHRAFAFWSQVLQGGEATASDRRSVVILAIALKRFEEANEAVRQILTFTPVSLKDYALLTEFYNLSGDRAKAREICRTGLAQQPDNAELRLLLARLLLSSELASDQAEAKRLLQEHIRLRGATTPHAIRLMANQPDLTRAELEELLTALSNYPLKDVEDELLVMELKLRLNPNSQGLIIDTTIAQFQDGKPAEKAALGRWLNRYKQFDRTIGLLDLPRAVEDRDLFLIRLDALAAKGDWQGIGKELDQARNPLEPVLTELFRARVAREQGLEKTEDLHWRRVHLEAGQTPQSLAYLARYAEQIGAANEASKLYQRLAQDPANTRAAYTALIRLAETTKNTRQLRELMRELINRFPDDPAPKNDLAYLNLLLNDDPVGSLVAGEKLFKEKPNMLAYRTTVALAKLRLNSPAEAKKMYEGVTLNWSEVLPGWQAVHAAVHGASGNTNAARVFAAQIPLDKLKPEEKALIDPYL